MNPCRVELLIVTDNIGPGIIAPERPIRNEPKKIRMSAVTNKIYHEITKELNHEILFLISIVFIF